MQKNRILILMAFVIAALVACENPVNSNNVDESGLDSGSGIGSGTLTIDGTDYELAKFYIDHEGYSDWNNNYEIDLRLFTEEVSFDGNTNSGTNNGYGVYFDMFYSDNEVTIRPIRITKMRMTTPFPIGPTHLAQILIRKNLQAAL